MADKPLAGKKVAVIVESQYIPGEIKIYQERFAGYGATVDLVSRLWGQRSARFHSTVDPGVVDQLEWLESRRTSTTSISANMPRWWWPQTTRASGYAGANGRT